MIFVSFDASFWCFFGKNHIKRMLNYELNVSSTWSAYA
jgi:hypothetical protein